MTIRRPPARTPARPPARRWQLLGLDGDETSRPLPFPLPAAVRRRRETMPALGDRTMPSSGADPFVALPRPRFSAPLG
ncbi:hypothetical protein AB4212_44990 [Streptomyces sp. 2MCAF27]